MATTVLLIGNLTNRIRHAEKRCAEAVEATAKDIAKDAKARVPVRSGRLRDSITPERIDEFTQIVTVHAEYAAFVEYGTRHMAAQPYLIPAVEAARQEFARRIAKAYE